MVNQKKNYYETLEITPLVSDDEIKSAYRRLARKFHPDVNNGDDFSAEKFKEITEAYEFLQDKSKRKYYDILNGFNKPTPKSNPYDKKTSEPKTQTSSEQVKKQASEAYSKTQTQKDSAKDKSFNDVFSEFMDGLFKKSADGAYTKTYPKGDDITVDINISITE
ncbi:MAG: DnaJ domain-containing protein, partial [Candidatus Gastranaerophilales bacterium]|nr:DnaJ domain-containing protein [Candidatus Gastranaerophilales bacterium]